MVYDKVTPVLIQGNTLKTWSCPSPKVDRVQVVLQTGGRPLSADVDLWQGPDNDPQKMRVYIEDGNLRPFSVVMETPRSPNTVCIRNTAQMEFPISAYVMAADSSSASPSDFTKSNDPNSILIQGGALRTFAFDPSVESVQVLLTTDGRPLSARVELLQGPNNVKQLMELYAEDGLDRPFFAVIETPGDGNVVRIINTATVEYPLTASVLPYMVGSSSSSLEPVIGGDTSRALPGGRK